MRIPSVKKKVVDFLRNEDGFLKKEDVLKGFLLSVGFMKFIFSDNSVYAGHGSNSVDAITVSTEAIKAKMSTSSNLAFCKDGTYYPYSGDTHASCHGSGGWFGHASCSESQSITVDFNVACYTHNDSYAYSEASNSLSVSHSHSYSEGLNRVRNSGSVSTGGDSGLGW
ncbi:hypothetical protein JXM83_06135 [Candidatus Woesearchaeota archaeon]|nr:hypothetical protein [Candidatus Woesearchaeota archaeon]